MNIWPAPLLKPHFLDFLNLFKRKLALKKKNTKEKRKRKKEKYLFFILLELNWLKGYGLAPFNAPPHQYL